MEENKDSLANLRANLSEYGLSLDNIPWVIQHNKRDLPNVYTLEELNAELNPGGKIPFFEAVAKDGQGVFETFRGISHLLMEKVTRDLRRTSGVGSARPLGEVLPDTKHDPVRPPQPSPLLSPPAHPVAHEAQDAPALAAPVVDYGREIELPGDGPVAPHLTTPAKAMPPSAPHAPAATPAPPAPAIPSPHLVEATLPRPVETVVRKPDESGALHPVEVAPAAISPASRIMVPDSAANSVGSAPALRKDSAVFAEAAARSLAAGWSVPPGVAPRVEAAVRLAVPMSGASGPAADAALGAAAPDAPGLAPRLESEELIVPIRLGAHGTHEIVLRIVLKLEG
jgi:hypothetical protein